MSTPARQMQSALRSTEEQNAINARLIRSIVDRDKVAFDQALNEGADVNAVGVRIPGRAKPTTHAPLISAIYAREPDFVKRLIDLGADVTVKDNRGISAVSACINVGYHNMLAAVLHANPNVIDSAGVNLVMQAILSFSSVGLIKGSTSCKELNDLGYYYHGDTITPPDTRGVELDYEGNIDVIRTLMLYAAARKDVLGKTVSKGDSMEATPWDLIQNPRPHIQKFLIGNPRDTVRCLTQPDDPEPQVLNFEVQFFPKTKKIDGGPDRPWVKVRYDFSDLIKELRPVVKEYRPNYELEQRFASTTQQHVQKFEVVQQQLGVHEERLGVHEEKIQILSRPQEEQARFDAWLDKPGNDNLRIFHDGIKIPLENIILGFKVASTDLVKTNLKDKQLDALKTVLGGLATLVNTAPLLGAPAAVGIIMFKKGADKVSGIRQRNVATYVAHFGDIKKTQEACASLARKLTQAYAQQLLALEYPSAAEKSQSELQRKLQEKKKDFLKAPFVGPAEQAAKFAMLWIVDQLYEANKIAEAVRERGLATVLFSCLIQQEPPKKLKNFWATELIAKVLGCGLLTRQGTPWDPQDFFTLPGIRVLEGDSPKFYTHSHSNPSIHGWRLVSSADLEHIKGFKLLPPSKAPVIENNCWFSEEVSSQPDRDRSSSAESNEHSNGSSGSQGKPPQPSAPITLAYNAARSSNLSPIGPQPMPIMPIFPCDDSQPVAQRQQKRR